MFIRRFISKLDTQYPSFKLLNPLIKRNAVYRRVDADRNVLRKHGLLLLRLKERVLMRVLASSEDMAQTTNTTSNSTETRCRRCWGK